MNREIRRRTRVIGAFPDGNSALMLVCARLRHVAGTQVGQQEVHEYEAPEGHGNGNRSRVIAARSQSVKGKTERRTAPLTLLRPAC